MLSSCKNQVIKVMLIHLKVRETHFYMHQEKIVHAEFKLSIASLMFIYIVLITKIARNQSLI